MSPIGPANEPTVDHVSSSSWDGERTQVVTVARVGATNLVPIETTHVLLRKRLLFVSMLLASCFIVAVIGLPLTNLPMDAWAYSAVGCLALGAIFAPVLRWRKALSLRQLRVIELILFGAYYLDCSLVQGFLYPNMRLPSPPIWYGFILAYAVSLPWTLLIIGYGILIPNTGKRCATVVGIMAFTPLVVSDLNGMGAQWTEGYSVMNYFGILALCMVVAVTIAVYGSHRIDRLRREAAEVRRLGQYQLGRRLGAGGMGEVYLAEHLLLKRPCAIKLIRSDRDDHPASLDRFEQEARATAALTHPNTVQVFDYGRADDGTFYYAMEYLPGMTLEQLVQRHGPLPPERAIHFLRQVCGALGEAHRAGMIHRDIKPSNILICERGGKYDVAKLLDFGLVLSNRPTRGEAIAGTPTYMSPEQANGEPIDPRSDLYSLGAVAFFLLVGGPPFPKKGVLEILAAHRTEPAKFPERLTSILPPDVQAIVLRCLEKVPSQRYRDSESLERAWTDCDCTPLWTAEEITRWWQEHSQRQDQHQDRHHES